MMRVFLMAALTVGLLSGCSTNYDRISKMREVSLASGVCVMHKVPLETLKGFRQDSDLCILRVDMDEYYKLPNPLPLEFEEKRSRFYPTPITVAYCPACEARFQKSSR